jgi:hypothetical protein
MVTGAFSPGLKRPRHETDHYPQSSAEVMDTGAIPPFLHRSSGVVLNYIVKYRDYFTFILSGDIIRMIKSRRMRFAWHVACMGGREFRTKFW